MQSNCVDTPPLFDVNGELVKTPLTLGHGSIITPYLKQLNY